MGKIKSFTKKEKLSQKKKKSHIQVEIKSLTKKETVSLKKKFHKEKKISRKNKKPH